MRIRHVAVATLLVCLLVIEVSQLSAGQLRAGVAKVDITNDDAGPAHGRMHARALVITNGETTAVIVSVDAVAIGEIGPIKNDYLGNVRSAVQEQLKISPANVMINASHCHGLVCRDVDQKTIEAITMAATNLEAVTVGVGRGHEDRVMENRRLKLKSGREIDVRHAYSMPIDADVAEVGPIDPEIGVVRFDREDGRTLAVVYNFACHPIQGVPSGANTADMTGFSSEVIEDNLDEGTVALFVQGCGGDINPVFYKEVNLPRNAESLGNVLGLSTLKAVRKIECKAATELTVMNRKLELPRADLAERISAMESEQSRLLRSLGGTTLSLKTFLPLVVKYRLDPEHPSYYSHRYLQEDMLGRPVLKTLDKRNRADMERYIRNVHTMEQLTRLQTNLKLLQKHQANYVAAGKRAVEVEVVGLRVGDVRLLTFPGELTVQIGLNLKKASPHKDTFIAGYTNGYIYYCPTADQLRNVGGAQEDSDCMLAPEWQKLFEDTALQMLQQL